MPTWLMIVSGSGMRPGPLPSPTAKRTLVGLENLVAERRAACSTFRLVCACDHIRSFIAGTRRTFDWAREKARSEQIVGEPVRGARR